MKIAFVNPPFLANYSRGQRSPGVTKAGTLYYPYWLALATGWAQKQGFEVVLFDFIAQGLGQQEAIGKVRKFKPDLTVIETSTPSIFNDLRFARRLRRNTKSFVLLVGTHVSALPEWSLKKAEGVDAAAVGEYDQTVVDLAKALDQRKNLAAVAGLVFWQKKKLIASRPRRPIENLDELPFISRVYQQFLNPRDYYFAAADYPMAMIISGRGCPYGCFYCLWPQTMHGLRYRYRSAENILAEFKFVRKSMPAIKEIVIEDDTFTARAARVEEFCRLLIKEKNKLRWSTNARVHLSLKTMRLMKKAGCRLLIVGYESGSQRVLDGMDKKIKLEDSLEFARNARRAGLLVHGCFMVGNPGETEETMRRTFEFAVKLDPDSAQFYPLFVYPGTRAYDWAKQKGYLKTRDFRRWLDKKGGHMPVIDLPGLKAEKMIEFCNQAYWRFHLRPAYLFKKVRQMIDCPEEGIRTMRSALRFAKNQLKQR